MSGDFVLERRVGDFERVVFLIASWDDFLAHIAWDSLKFGC